MKDDAESHQALSIRPGLQLRPQRGIVMREPTGKLASEWTIVHGLSIHARVSVNPVPAEAPAIIMVHGLVVSSRYMVPTALQLAP